MSSLRRTAGSLLESEQLWVLAMGAAFALIVFLSQNRVVGWEPGYNELQPGHHGWVSSHTLAVIAHATPANGFVGYAEAYITDEGQLEYRYFDRYPVFFSAAMHWLLSLKPRLSTQVYLAKQAMNGIFVLTVVVAYLLLRKLSLTPLRALTACLLAVASPYLIFYKDMVHFDQPALLGMLVLILAIALQKINGQRYVIYGATLLAVGLGRGYASLVVLLVWFALEAIEVLGRRGLSFRQRIGALFTLTAFRALVLGTAWAAWNLTYNIQMEAVKRGVPTLETSIIRSASKRLALDSEFNAANADVLDWRFFISDELIRLVRWSFPIWTYEGSWLVSAGIIGLMLAVIIRFGRTLDPARREILKILTLSGPIWLFGLRNLSAFHDYTAMYFIGIPLAFFASVAALVRLPRLGWTLAAAFSLAVFTARNAQMQNLHREIGGASSAYTHDFMRIAAALPSQGQSIYLDDQVPDAPFAPGFYLPGQYLAPLQFSDYSISRKPRFQKTNLTPENSRLFLFKND